MKTPKPTLEEARKESKKGQALITNGKYADAIEVLQKIAPVFEEAEDWEGYVDCLDKKFEAVLRSGKIEEGLAMGLETLVFSQQRLGQSSVFTASVWNTLGMAYWLKGDYNESFRVLNKSLEIKVEVLGERHKSTIGSYNNLGVLYGAIGQYNDAIKYHHKSLQAKEKIFNKFHSSIAQGYDNIGVIYWKKGDYEKAIEYQQKGLKIRLKTLGEFHPSTADSFNNLGLIYDEKGDYQQALNHYHKSLAIKLKTLPKLHTDIAITYANIGIAYCHNREYTKAIDYQSKSLEQRKKLFDFFHPSISKSYHELGITHFCLGNLEQSYDCYQQSLSIRLKLEQENHPETATILNDIGLLHEKKEAYKKALQYHSKALQIRKKVFGNLHPDIAANYKDIGRLYSLQKKHYKALQHHQLALQPLFPHFNKSDHYQNPSLQNCLSHPVLLEVLQSKAQIFLQYYLEETNAPKDLQAALSTYHLATELIAEMRQGYKAEGSKLILAEKATTVFDGAIETALLTAQSENLDDTFTVRQRLERVFQYSEQSKAVLLLSSIKDTEAKASANIPEELLQKEYDLRIELTYLDKRIQQEELKLVLKGAKKDQAQIREWQSQHFDHQQAYDQLIEQFEVNYPEYYQLKYNLTTASIPDLQNYLQSSTLTKGGFRNPPLVSVISYHIAEEKIYIFSITSNDYQIHTLQKPSNFAQLIEDFQDAIVLARIKTYLQSAGALFDLLLRPILETESAKDLNKLILIPHNELSTLPFDALIDTRNLTEEKREELIAQRDFSALPYLIKEYDISYHYSATLLLNTAKRQAKTTIQEASFIGFAPVNFEHKRDVEGEQTELAIATNRGKTRVLRSNRSGQMAMDNLPNTESEVKEVFELFEQKELDAKAFLYASANKQNLAENAQNHKYVLIATHGYVQDGNAGLSGIYLAKQRAGARSQEAEKLEIENGELTIENLDLEGTDDKYRRFSKTSLQTHEHPNTQKQLSTQTPKNTNYILHTSEAYHLQLNADLVVLSSCSSGVGKIAKGEGMMAMNRGFLAAGASNIVFTHFDIPDESSGDLVKALFAYILESQSQNGSYASALRKAKLKLIHQSLKTPEDWAGYALIGA